MERATLIALSLASVLLLVGSIVSFIMCNLWWAFCQLGMMVIALYAVNAQVEEIKRDKQW
jgi:hypothetical protein